MRNHLILLGIILISFSIVACAPNMNDDDDDGEPEDDDDIATDDDNVSDDDTSDDDDDDDDDNDDNDIISPGFVLIESSTFMMGSPNSEGGRELDEKRHEVTLTRNFEISIFETTQTEFTTLMDWNPSHFGPNGTGEECGDDCPVENVSWFDAIAYANRLSSDNGYSECYLLSDVSCEDGAYVGTNYMECMSDTRGGVNSAVVAINNKIKVYDCDGYRLPTEAEWEYAIRAGTGSAFYNGDISDPDSCVPGDENMNLIGWYCGNDSEITEEVGQKMANAWGLYDMSGNVREWVWDWYAAYGQDISDPAGPANGSKRVNRGGGFNVSAGYCRSAERHSDSPGDREYILGFRLVRTMH